MEKPNLPENPATMEVSDKLLTYEEYRSLEFGENDNSHYELLNGILVKKDHNTIHHQRISGNICFKMSLFLEKGEGGEVFAAPLDVVLDDYNAPQPDLFFVGKDKKYILDEEEQVVIGTPDIVVEILSPGSVKRDRIEKKAVYERSGVQEFWIVDPSYRNVEMYHLVEGRYELLDMIEETGVVKSTVLEGFELEISKVF